MIGTATWQNDGINLTLINGTDYIVLEPNFTITNADYAWTQITVNYNYTLGVCECPGLNQNWEIDHGNYCNITLECNLGTGYLNFTGTGTTKINVTINTTNMGDPGANGIIYILDSALINIFN